MKVKPSNVFFAIYTLCGFAAYHALIKGNIVGVFADMGLALFNNLQARYFLKRGE